VQPGIKAIGVTQTSNVSPGGDQRVLDRVVGKVAIPQDQVSDTVQPADRRGCQLRERGMVAG